MVLATNRLNTDISENSINNKKDNLKNPKFKYFSETFEEDVADSNNLKNQLDYMANNILINNAIVIDSSVNNMTNSFNFSKILEYIIKGVVIIFFLYGSISFLINIYQSDFGNLQINFFYNLYDERINIKNCIIFLIVVGIFGIAFNYNPFQ